MLRRPTEKILVNNPDSATQLLTHAGEGAATILGIQFPLDGNNDLLYCVKKTCSQPGTPKVVNIQVDFPAPSCGCIEEFAVKIKKHSRGVYDLKDVRPMERVYVYDVPANTTPDNATAAAFIVAAINADKSIGITATVTGANSDIITLTANDGINFDAYLPTGMATFLAGTAHVAPVLTSEQMFKLFPNKIGYWGGIPQVPVEGNAYCKYTIKLTGTTQDLAHSLGYINFEQEVELYVNRGCPVGGVDSAAFTAFNGALAALSLGGAFCS